MDAFKKFVERILKVLENKKLSDKKLLANLCILLLVGVLIVLTASFFKTSSTFNIPTMATKDNKDSNKSSEEAQKVVKEGDYENQVQSQLKNTLEKIDGVGKVEVMVSFSTGEEQIPAVNINDSTNTTEEKDNEGGVRSSTQKNNGSTVVITNEGGKSEPLIVKKCKPKVSGVCVVAEGAENRVTELRICKAVVNLFSIAEDKVNVYPMKK